MKTIINWTAKRAGGRITVYGVDEATHKPLKVVGVDLIEAARRGGPIATTKDGVKYELGNI